LPSSDESWRAVPVALLRHAGYPVSDLDHLADDTLARRAHALLDAWHTATAEAAAMRPTARDDNGAFGAALGSLRHLSGEHADLVAYSAAVAEFDRLLADLESGHADAVAVGRARLAELFADPWRQQVLLLSNPAVLDQVRDWLADPHSSGARTRKLADLLTMYMQRITTKNETNSHFGPFAVARFDQASNGVAWSMREAPDRFAFLAHWAASRLLSACTPSPDTVRPRPHPLAFPTSHGPIRYDYVDGDGLPYPWVLSGPTEPLTDVRHRWLFGQVDGERTVGSLRELWSASQDTDGFDTALAALVDRGLIVAEAELPAGEANTISGLRTVNAPLADRLDVQLADFATAPPGRRVRILAALTDSYTEIVAAPAVRRLGQHYADRGVLFEECVSRVHEVAVGPEVERFVTEELAEVYDGILFGSRLRLAAERAVFAEWLDSVFGPERDVALGDVLERHLADRAFFVARCDVIDREVAAAERGLAETLLQCWDGRSEEVDMPVGTVRALLTTIRDAPAAVCNPDVMIAAPNADAIRRGDFLGIVGDCHAVRDLLTHGPFVPLLRQHAPDLAAHVLAGYRRVIDADEVLVDVVRAHDSKIAAQWELPVPHLEIAGRSPKSRADVLLPRDLRLRVDSRGDVSLHACRFEGRRVRLMASMSGADSIRHDPTALFAFARSLGGGLLSGVDLPHLPRLRMGRAVLTRRRWRVPVGELDGWRPFRRFASADARLFVSAALLRERLHLPRQVFAKFPHEPKPVYVDWHAPLLVRQFHRLARGAPAAATVELTEMLPAPEDLWLDIDGSSYTAELRCTVFSR
jgi:hypothetical protein